MQLTADHLGRCEQRRAASEHARTRKLNDRLATQEAEGALAMPRLLVCECARPECAETVEVSPTEYAAARSRTHLYVVAPGHDLPGVTEVLVDVERRFSIVELVQSADAAAA